MQKENPIAAIVRKQRRRFARGMNKKNPKFASKVRMSEDHFGDILEFAIQPGIDPNLVQNLISEASSLQQEGQTKIVISRQLFEQIQAALQNYNLQKQQIDGMTVERLRTQGFEAGKNLIELASKDELTTIDERKDKIIGARKWKRRGKQAVYIGAAGATGAGLASLRPFARMPGDAPLPVDRRITRPAALLAAGGLGTVAAAKLYEAHQRKKIKARRARNLNRRK